jgi:cephalosporin hydroxylase
MRPHFTGKEIILIVLVLFLTGLLAFERPFPGDSNSRPQSMHEVIDNFHKLFYESSKWSSTRWLGVTALQNPNDAWIHQEIIVDVKPDFIVEAGTLYGGSAALWATVLQQVNAHGRVITIDIKDQSAEAKKLPIVKQYVDFMIGSSTDPAIVGEITKRVGGRKVLVILDSDHSKDHVLAEMKAYAPLVSVGSYLIVQDTNINGHPVFTNFGPGPMEAVQEFLASNQQFKPDSNAERLMFTMHPKGYLKRIY